MRTRVRTKGIRGPEYYVAVTKVGGEAEDVKRETEYMKPGRGTERYAGRA